MSDTKLNPQMEKNNPTEKIYSILICSHIMIKEGFENICRKSQKFSLVKSYQSFKSLNNSDFNNNISIVLICPICNKEHLKHPDQMIPEINNYFPNGNIIIIDDIFTDEEKGELIKLGVKGFLHENISSENIIRAFYTILRGEFWISRNLSKNLIDQLINISSNKTNYTKPENIYKLSNREIEILQAIASGLTNLEISNKLFISEKTVKAHIYNIFKKMDVKTRTKAVIKAMESQSL
ncbi:MAG: response regulator transcription factor [Acidobacteriota bacterium]